MIPGPLLQGFIVFLEHFSRLWDTTEKNRQKYLLSKIVHVSGERKAKSISKTGSVLEVISALEKNKTRKGDWEVFLSRVV